MEFGVFLSVLATILSAHGAVAAPGSPAANCTARGETGAIQMLTYVKRKPGTTREAFWNYWQTQHAPRVAPLAVHFNILRYQQVRAGGMILPQAAGSPEPESRELVGFDGVALFLYTNPDDIAAFVAHPYYKEVVAPDEAVFIDTQAYNGGMVATYVGPHVDVVEGGDDVWAGDDSTRAEYQALFDKYNA